MSADPVAVTSFKLRQQQPMQETHVQHKTLHRIDDAESREIQQQVETMIGRLKVLRDSELTSEFANQLSIVEVTLANQTSDSALTNEISATRADLCVELGFEVHEFQDCDSFMRTACSRSGRNAKIPQDKCTALFDEE